MRALRRVPASGWCGRIENHRVDDYFVGLILSIGSLLLVSCQLILFCYWLLLVYCNMRFTLIYTWFLPFTKNYLKSASLLYGTIATYLGGRYRGRLWRKIARRSGKHYWFFCNYMPDGALIIQCICWLYNILVVHAPLNYILVVNLVSWCCVKLLLLFACLAGLRKCTKSHQTELGWKAMPSSALKEALLWEV